MKSLINLALTASSCLLCVSCSQKKPEAPVETPLFVGTVESVYPKYKYAMIYLAGGIPEEGTVLITQSSDPKDDPRTANLVVGAERLGSRVPADIRSGSVQKGDMVFQYKNLAPPVASEEKETPESILGPDSIVPPAPAPGTDEPGKKAPETVQPAPSYNGPSVDDYLDTVPKTLEEANKLR